MKVQCQPIIADLDRMKKASSAVYLACEASVADDISAMFRSAISEIEYLRARVAILDRCCEKVDCLSRGEAMQQKDGS